MFRITIPTNRILNVFLELIVASFIILWCYTAITKLFDFSNFSTQLSRSPFIEGVANIIAYTLPPGELLISLLLVFKRTRKLGMYLSFGVMLLFTGYIFLMLTYAYDLPCSCGGVLSKMTWHDHLWFNIGFTVLGVIGTFILETKEIPARQLAAGAINTSKK